MKHLRAKSSSTDGDARVGQKLNSVGQESLITLITLIIRTNHPNTLITLIIMIIVIMEMIVIGLDERGENI